MIRIPLERRLRPQVELLLSEFPAVAILGPRQVGKTTLATLIADERDAVYLDLERPADLAKLSDPELYLDQYKDRLVIIDEVQRLPGLFRTLRGLIDEGRRSGRKTGRYLLLGSASIDLLKQSLESLAGRIAYVELHPLNLLETPDGVNGDLWIRGGFPDSLLASSDEASMRWRHSFIRTYLERDIPQLGPRIPAESLRRFWTMLAHLQGSLLNAAQLARSLGSDWTTISRYLDLMVDLLLVRRLQPWHGNTGKRLIKSPKTYVRDSGLLHTLLGIGSREELLGHPVAGASWEGYVIENLASSLPEGNELYFYRSAGGAEIDLIIGRPGGRTWAVEIKRSLSPKPRRGFHHAREDVKPDQSFVVYPGSERYPISDDVECIPVEQLASLVAGTGIGSR
ncbi:MAG: ATP-binding protein [Rhodothermales bacterium]|nr:ATP-binding protein [Rhodothermales bacterium]MBO6779401.1 ATP-binding protein [Rhodothermales bacterium]